MFTDFLLDLLEKEIERKDASAYSRGRYNMIRDILDKYIEDHSIAKEYLETVIEHDRGGIDVLKEILEIKEENTMYIKTESMTGTKKTLTIDNPRFDVESIRKIKSLIRFNIGEITGAEPKHDMNVIMKYGRCYEYSTINGALVEMLLRVAGKEGKDTIYHLVPTYNNGKIDLEVMYKLYRGE